MWCSRPRRPRQLGAKASKKERDLARSEFFSKGRRVCVGRGSASAMAGAFHADAEGRIALYSVDSGAISGACAPTPSLCRPVRCEPSGPDRRYFGMGLFSHFCMKALKTRRPLLGRARMLPCLGAAHAFAVALVGSQLIQLAAGEFVDGALHAGHCLRCVGRQRIGQPSTSSSSASAGTIAVR